MVKKVKFNINLGNKTFYTLIAILSLAVIGIVVYAYDGGRPLVHGHDANEIANLPSGGGSGVSITGSLVLNGTLKSIPVPSGYTKSQCSYSISVGNIGRGAIYGDHYWGDFDGQNLKVDSSTWVVNYCVVHTDTEDCINGQSSRYDPVTVYYTVTCGSGSGGSGTAGILTCATSGGIPAGSSGDSICAGMGSEYVCTSVTAADLGVGGTYGSSSATCGWVSTAAGNYKARCCKIL